MSIGKRRYMKKQSKSPQIRFQNFEDEWVNQRLGKTVEIIMGQSPDSKNYTDNPNDYVLVQGNADMQNGRVVPRVWTTQTTKIAEKGDLILSVRAPVGDIGKTDYRVVLGRGVAAIKGDDFLFYLLSKMKQFNYWAKFSTGSTFESINSGDIKSAEIMIPSLDEQSAIGSLFRTLDDLLASYKDNLANYQSLKATMLAKMFPKAGQTVPEIRIEGFEGEWEKLKLRDVVHTNPKSELPENFKYIDLESVVGTRINKIREERKESAPSRAQRLAKKGDVFYQTVRPYQKNNYLFKLDEIDYVFSTGYAQLRPIFKRCDSDFLLILLQNNRFLSKVLDRCTGTSYPAINVNDLIEILIAIPSYDEQQAIGSYFSNLDNLIAAHQEKISQLETLKKKLLQDMFI